MKPQTTNKNRANTVLIIFVLLNIIGDIGNVVVWHANPSSRGSIVPGEMSGVATKGGFIYAALNDAGATLAVGSALLLIVAVVYAVAAYGLLRRQKWGALVVIAISVVNRVIAVFLFELNPAFAFWAVWTVVLVTLAALDYRKLTRQTAQPPV
ncbi:MAG: hypothetical protein ACE14S_10310 [Candidatus Bathyarchaeia archaeon]